MTEPTRRSEVDSPPALEACVGSVPGMSFHLKAPEKVVVSKNESVLTVTVPRFQRAMLRTTAKVTAFAFVLEPADEHNEYTFGPFYVRGRYRVTQVIKDSRRASDAFRAFQPS